MWHPFFLAKEPVITGAKCIHRVQRKIILFVRFLTQGESQQFHCFTLTGNVRKTQLESGENRSSQGFSFSPQHFKSQDIIGVVHHFERIVPFFDWSGGFFLLYYFHTSTDLLIVSFLVVTLAKGHRAKQRETWADWSSDEGVVSGSNFEWINLKNSCLKICLYKDVN